MFLLWVRDNEIEDRSYCGLKMINEVSRGQLTAPAIVLFLSEPFYIFLLARNHFLREEFYQVKYKIPSLHCTYL